jgi:hypothetical protein
MTKTRVEAFSDGVLAIVITIMVLELKAPHEPHFRALTPLCVALLGASLALSLAGARDHRCSRLALQAAGRRGTRHQGSGDSLAVRRRDCAGLRASLVV